MTKEILKALFKRDLERLYKEISLYANEGTIWQTAGQVSNSAGNLCLHLVGNLNTFIGKEIGKTSYVRNRELEFSATGIAKQTLLQMVADTMEVVDISLDHLHDDQLGTEYPVLVFEEKKSTGYMLIHLIAHLNYHLGQVNYHRRLLDEKSNN